MRVHPRRVGRDGAKATSRSTHPGHAVPRCRLLSRSAALGFVSVFGGDRGRGTLGRLWIDAGGNSSPVVALAPWIATVRRRAITNPVCHLHHPKESCDVDHARVKGRAGG